MKQLLQQYAAYNLWANQRITGILINLEEAQLHREIVSSFTSIYKTATHAWGAEYIWYLRMLQLPMNDLLPSRFTGTVTELSNEILQQSGLWREWIDTVTEDGLLAELPYTNLAGDKFEQPVYLLLQHVFNHNTFHRGQLVTMFRQVGVTKIPSTDFVTFTRL